MISSPIVYPGGKHYLVEWIVDRFPRKFKIFVDVFGGAANVIANNRVASHEIYNDTNSDMFNFFTVLRDKRDEFFKRVEFLPRSREMFREYSKKYDMREWTDDVDRAIGIMYVTKYAHGGYWQRRKQASYNNDFGKKPRCIDVDNVIAFANRMRTVQLEHVDFRKLIDDFDSIETFFYCDPPYVDESMQLYDHAFTEQDHRDLAALLRGIKGKFLLSYTEHPLIRELYSDCEIETMEIANFAKNTRGRRIELFISNYKTDRMETLL